MSAIPFQTIHWDEVPQTTHQGTTGTAYWKTVQLDDLRIRIVTYNKGYLADHWCRKGHVVHCLKGAFTTELETGERITLTAGMSYVVSDELSAHRSFSEEGVQLLIVDGDFLR